MTTKLALTQAHDAMMVDYNDLKQLVAEMRWEMPVIAPTLPTTAGSALTARVTIPSTSKTFASSGKKFQGVPLGYKLDSSGLANFDFDSITLQDIELAASNVGFRSYGKGTIRNLLVERMRLANGIFTQGIPSGLIYSLNTRLENAVFRDLLYNGADNITDGSAIVAAFALSGKTSADTGDNILLEDFDFRNLVITGQSGYPNSDGVSIESGYNNVRVRRGFVSNVMDACYDIKSIIAWLDDVYGETSRQTFKFWNDNHHGALYSVNPRFAHLLLVKEVSGAWDGPIIFEHLNCRSSIGLAPVFRCEEGPRQIIVKSYDLTGLRPGTPLITMDSKSTASTIDWGPQGAPVI